MADIRTFLLGALSLVGASQAVAGQSLCVYHNRTYSDGAHICIQRQLLMTCAAEGGRAMWRIVDDARLARLCAKPVGAGQVAQQERPASQWPGDRRQAAAGPTHVPTSGKCFMFLGRHYCE